MKRTDVDAAEKEGERPAPAELDFDRVRRRAASLVDQGSGRSVREATVRVVSEEFGFEAAAVFDREADRYRASAATPAFESLCGQDAVSAVDSLVGRAVSTGETERTEGTGLPEGVTAACAAPFGGASAVVVLADEAGGTVTPAAAAALALVAGYAGVALSGLEGGIVRRAAGAPSAEGGLSDALSCVLPEYVFVLDADGTCLDVLLGSCTPDPDSRAPAVGDRIRDLVDGPTADSILAAVDEGSVRTVEGSMSGDDERRYEARIAPLSREDAPEGAAVLAAREVTERHERERSLRRQNERLEEFADIVSHDLRNPLNTAAGFLELAAAESEDSRLDRVAGAHDRMETLVDDLLALARHGREVTDPEPVELRGAAGRAWRTVSPDGRLVVADDATVRADPGRLQQAFENVFRNAAEHADPAPAVRVGTTPDGFYVEDDGPGVPPAERERVFDSGYTTADDGTGLGLAIVGRVAEAHGWSVGVTDGRDGGARFEFDGVTFDSRGG